MPIFDSKPGFWERLVDFVFAVKRRRERAELEKLKALLIQELDSPRMDKIVELLLFGMSLLFLVDRQFRANIRGFSARYAFTSQDRGIGASAIFKTGWLFKFPRMLVRTVAVENPQITIEFKDGRSLAEFLLSPRPDLFSAVLDRRLSYSGNLNYILKFVYMARHIPRHLGITLPDFG